MQASILFICCWGDKQHWWHPSLPFTNYNKHKFHFPWLKWTWHYKDKISELLWFPFPCEKCQLNTHLKWENCTRTILPPRVKWCSKQVSVFWRCIVLVIAQFKMLCLHQTIGKLSELLTAPGSSPWSYFGASLA